MVSMEMMRLFEEGETVKDVTDKHNKNKVKSRSRCSVNDIPGHVKSAINKVKFKPSRTESGGFVLNFFAEIMIELRRNRVGHVISEAAKAVITQILPKIEPRQLKEEMKSA